MKEKKVKVLAFMIAHYSGDYLKETLLSVRDHVDKMVVAYSRKPSQSHGDGTICPDTREYIYDTCVEILGDKLIWDEKELYHIEAEHRNVKYTYSSDFDVVLTVDADEVMIGIPEAIEYAMNNPERHFGIKGYVNFFRSFSWACYDDYRPCRIEVLNRANQNQNLECKMTILHFSCAQRREVMEYKYKNFGHSSEIRPNYLQDIFYAWYPGSEIRYLHAVSTGIWESAVFYDKRTMPEYLKQHKNYNLDLIP